MNNKHIKDNKYRLSVWVVNKWKDFTYKKLKLKKILRDRYCGELTKKSKMIVHSYV